MAAAGLPDFDVYLTQIKTHSVERTLLPLVKQVRQTRMLCELPQTRLVEAWHYARKLRSYDARPTSDPRRADDNRRSYALSAVVTLFLDPLASIRRAVTSKSDFPPAEHLLHTFAPSQSMRFSLAENLKTCSTFVILEEFVDCFVAYHRSERILFITKPNLAISRIDARGPAVPWRTQAERRGAVRHATAAEHVRASATARRPARGLRHHACEMDALSDDDEYTCREPQISSLVATRGEAAAGGAAVQRVGAAVACAVERFVAVGETIADDNPDVRHSMVLACKEARAADLSQFTSRGPPSSFYKKKRKEAANSTSIFP
ncbi:unnamed protein product [Colias eurytheme]|nr:unnamed protein product [Colias eurytheme]